MPTSVLWRGDAQATAQQESYTCDAASGVGQLYTVTISNKLVTFTTVTGTESDADVALALFTLLAAEASPEFQEVQWDYVGSGPVITGTAKTPGSPFTTSVTGNITKATVVAGSGPADLANHSNYTPSFPVNGDSLTFPGAAALDALYNLDALNAITFVSVRILCGNVGLPSQNQNGYFEYRLKSLQIKTATTIEIGDGITAPTFCRIYVDQGSPRITVRGPSFDVGTTDGPTYLFTTGAATPAWEFLGGNSGLAYEVGEVMVATTLKVGTSLAGSGSFANTDPDPVVQIGDGATISAARLNSGSVYNRVNVASLVIASGLWVQETGNINGVTATGGVLRFDSAGTLGAGAVVMSGDGTLLDFSGGVAPITNTAGSYTFTGGAFVSDPNRRTRTFTYTADAASYLAMADAFGPGTTYTVA